MTKHVFKLQFLLFSILLWMSFLIVVGLQFQGFKTSNESSVLGVKEVIVEERKSIEFTVPEGGLISIDLPEVLIQDPVSPVIENPIQSSYQVPSPRAPDLNSEPAQEEKNRDEQEAVIPPEKEDNVVENPDGNGGYTPDLDCYKANPYSYWDGERCVDPRV